MSNEMFLEDKVKTLEKQQIDMREQLDDQARLLLAIGRKVMRLDSRVRKSQSKAEVLP